MQQGPHRVAKSLPRSRWSDQDWRRPQKESADSRMADFEGDVVENAAGDNLLDGEELLFKTSF